MNDEARLGPVPLFEKEDYLKLCDLRARLDPDGAVGLRHPFVPVGCDPNVRAPFRILFVGQSLLREDARQAPARHDYDDALGWSQDVFEAMLAEDSPRSPFWHFIRSVVGRVAAEIIRYEIGPASYRELAGWSNLAKIPGPRGNPSSASLKAQANACVECLRTELAFFRPDAVVITSGDFADVDIIQPVFGSHLDWTPDPANPIRNLTITRLDKPYLAIWTDHPRNMGQAGNLEETRGFVSDQIVRWLRER